MFIQHTACQHCGGSMEYMPPTQYRERKIFTTYKCRHCGQFLCLEEALC